MKADARTLGSSDTGNSAAPRITTDKATKRPRARADTSEKHERHGQEIERQSERHKQVSEEENEMSSEVDKFLAEHADFIALEATGKIRCTLTGHECKATIELLHEHVRGRKYAQALRDRAMTEKPIDLSRFDFIIQHVSCASRSYSLSLCSARLAVFVEILCRNLLRRLTFRSVCPSRFPPIPINSGHQAQKVKEQGVLQVDQVCFE